MKRSREAECEEFRRLDRIDAAFKAGDLEALRTAVEDPSSIPNGPMPLAIGPCLEYAVYHSPLAFIETLLQIGADPNPDDHAGFPPLIAALSCSQPQPGSPGRSDVVEVVRLLIAHGADVHQRGVNDYTPLHAAVAWDNAAAIRVLLDAGADPRVRTRIDDYETPREMARAAGFDEIARLLEAREQELAAVTSDSPPPEE
jgi:ankyrin repeat protein